MEFKSEQILQVLVPVPPKPKQSVRFGGGRAFTCPKHKKYVAQVKNYVQLFAPDEPFTGALCIDLTFYFPWRKSEPKKNKLFGWIFKDTKPDNDNCVKPIQDALEAAGFYVNDSQISRLIATKIWCSPTVNPEGETLVRLYKLHIEK